MSHFFTLFMGIMGFPRTSPSGLSLCATSLSLGLSGSAEGREDAAAIPIHDQWAEAVSDPSENTIPLV